MANKLIKGLTIQIGADTSALGRAMQSAEAQVRSARGELKEIETALKHSGDSAELWQQKQLVVTNALEESKRKLEILKTAQKSLSDQLKDGDIDKAAYDKFQDKLSRVRDRLSELKKQQENVEAQFRSGSIDKDAYEKFQRRVESAEKKVRDLETAEHSLEENMQLDNITEEQYRAFKREIESAEGDIRYFSGRLDDTNEKLREMGSKADGAADDVDGLGDSTRNSGQQAENAANGGYTVLKNVFSDLVTDGIRLAARELKNFTADVITTGMTFEASMSSVGAISGASAEELELLSSKAKEMGASTRFTAAESAEAFQYMAMAGWKTEDMLSGIGGILSLAAASGERLATTSDIVTDAVTAFGLTANDTGHFVDVLAAASSNANTNVSMMGETFKYAAPVAGAMGFSIEDTAEAIGLMANSGIKASQAGTSLRTIMTDLSEGVTLTGSALGEMTVETSNADGTMRSLGDILGDLRKGWTQLTESEQAANAESIAGKNAMSGFLALMNAAPEDIGKLSEAIEDCDGAASEMSATMQNNLSGDVTLLESAVDGMKISISEKLSPVLREIVRYVTEKMPDIESLLTGVFTVGGKVVKGAVQHLPQIAAAGRTLLPVIAAVGTAPKVLSTATKAVDALNKIMSANPALAVTAAIVGLTAALAALYISHKDEKTIAEQVADEYADERKAIEDTRSEMNKLKDDYNRRSGDTHAELQRTQELWQELDKLTDSNGNVRKADEERAKYILGELNTALGTEYTMTQGQIKNYKELAENIDSVIAKKKAEKYLDDYLASASEMAKTQADSLAQYETAYAQKESAEKELAAAREEYERITGKSYMEMSPSDYIEHYDGAGKEYRKGVEAAKRLERANAAATESRINAETAFRTYNEALSYNEKLKEAQTAFSEERYDDVERILYAAKDANKELLEDAKSFSDEAREAYNDSLTRSRADLSAALKSGKQEAVDTAVSAMTETLRLGQQAGAKGSELITDEVKAQVNELIEQGFDISSLAQWAKDSGISIGELFGDDYAKVVQSQLDKGYDITALSEWCKNSGAELADVFGEDYTKVIQKQLDEGYDVTKLLEWGMSSGELTGDEFWKYYDQNCKNGFSNTFGNNENENSLFKGIMDWARKTGKDAGDLFGENYSATVSEWTRWLYADDGGGLKVPKSIQSASDAAFAQNNDGGYTYRIGFYADGGDIHEGQGIIAEAGPELVTVKNGIATVTPLTDTAMNTPVPGAAALLSAGIPLMAKGGYISQGRAVVNEVSPELVRIMNGAARAASRYSEGGAYSSDPAQEARRIFYNSYTINAEISGDYDVSRLAERLAREQQRIEAGRGR